MEDIIRKCDKLGLGNDIYKLIVVFATHSLCNQKLRKLFIFDDFPDCIVPIENMEAYWGNERIELSAISIRQSYGRRRSLSVRGWNISISALEYRNRIYYGIVSKFDGVIVCSFTKPSKSKLKIIIL